jgi:glycosyltransferase involved in cell wall biosynthesis
VAADPPRADAAIGATVSPPTRRVARATVSVVICSFTEDRWDDLTQALHSLRDQTEAPLETILVVDHCPELLRRAMAELQGVIIVPNRLERGLAGGRNTGASGAQGDVVAFLDDDAVADSGWLAKLADSYTDPKVLGVGGLVKPKWDAVRPDWFRPELDWVVGCSYRGMPGQAGRVRNFIGANMSFRRNVLDELGGFSISLGRVGTAPLGCEETELCLRIGQRYPDGVLLYEPAASVSHRVRAQRAGWGYLRSRCYAEGLSKAKVSKLVGSRRALASERSYVLSIISRGVGSSLMQAARGQLSGFTAALALLLAVVVTTTGYTVGRVSGLKTRLIQLPASQPRAARVTGTPGYSVLVPWAGLTASVALWAAALATAEVTRVETAGLGLVTVLPDTFWAALAVLTVSFTWAVVHRPTRWPVLAAHTLALVVILRATPAILYQTLRYSWAWKHVGVIDYISHHGVNFHLGGVLGAYQGWPGFFALNSFLLQASGQPSALGYANWVLPVNDLIWLGPVLLIARAFTADQRLIWTAAWLFELGNWVGQDYFSPQAFAYFLYLTVIAICLRWFRNRQVRPRLALASRVRWIGHLRRLPLPARLAGLRPVAGARSGPRPPGPPATVNGYLPGVPIPVSRDPTDRRSPRSAFTRRAMLIFLLPLMAAIASSHQLTPFMLIAALALLVLFRQIRGWVLPVAMAAITVGWIAYGGLPWLAQNSSQLLEGVGLPWANTSAHLIGETQVPPDQVTVEWGARLLSAAIAALAGVGFLRHWKAHRPPARRFWLSIPILAAAGLPAVAANSYGGEIIFRVFLFAVPFLAVAGGAAFFPHPRAGRPVRTGVALAATLLALVAGFSLSNYGSEQMNYFSPAEVAAADWLYQTAPAGAQVIAANSNFPWAFVHYNWYSYTFLDTPASLGRDVLRAPVSAMARLMEPHHSPASYLILTRGQAAEIYLTAEWPAGAFSRLTRALLASVRFRVVYHNPDAVIFQLAPPGFRQLAPDGVLLLSPAAVDHVSAALTRQPHSAVLGPKVTKASPNLGHASCRSLPAPLWRDPASPLPTPVPGQTPALLRRCR